jgi:hypothetical protein
VPAAGLHTAAASDYDNHNAGHDHDHDAHNHDNDYYDDALIVAVEGFEGGERFLAFSAFCFLQRRIVFRSTASEAGENNPSIAFIAF